MKLDTKQREIINTLMKKYNLEEKEVIEIIESPFTMIREKIQSIELKGISSEEEFNEKTLNFNIPCIGKLYASWRNYKYINKLWKKE